METFIYYIETAAQKWFPFMAQSSLQLGLFFGVILVLTKMFRNQSARFLYLLWIVFLVKAIIPPTIRMPAFFSVPEIISMQKIPLAVFPIINANTGPSINLSYQGYAFLVWIFGITALLIFILSKNILFFRKIIRSRREFQLEAGLISQKTNQKKIRFFMSLEINSPFVLGFFSPKIYVPEHALKWPEKELQAVIYHEIAHIQRKDIIMIFIQNIIQSVYFFHPLVWIANIQVARYREKACDDFAIQSMQGNSMDYSKFLLNSLDRVVKWQAIPSLTNYFHPSRKFLFQRFEYILTRKEQAMNKLTILHKIVFVGVVVFALALSCDREKSIQQSLAPNLENGEIVVLKAGLVDSQIVAYDTPPRPVGGFETLAEYLNYPAFAKEAGFTFNVNIKESGEVYGVQMSASPEINNFTAQQMAVISEFERKLSRMVARSTWNPATKDGKPIAAWVTLPLKYDRKIIIEKISSDAKTVPPPKLPENASSEFVPYDKEPRPIGGFAAIHKNLQYPEIARRAGIEGTVVLYVQIGEQGDVVNTKVIKSLGDNGCDEAAVAAIKKVKWVPAEYEGVTVKVWVSVPVRFRLSSEGEGNYNSKSPTSETDTRTGGTLALIAGNQMRVAGRVILSSINKKGGSGESKIETTTIPEPVTLNTLNKRGLTNYISQNLKGKKTSGQDVNKFLPYEKEPKPVGGFGAIVKNLHYPEIAKKAGIEGAVNVACKIGENGDIVETKIKKSLGDNGCDEAAIEALKNVKWIPAKKDGKPVEVWITVPVQFKLSQK